MNRQRLFLFGGADPQTSSSLTACDGAWMVGAALDRRDPKVAADWTRKVTRDDFDFNFVFGRILRGFGHSEWAAYLHAQHRQWAFANVALDNGAGGGGPEIERRLAKAEQELPTDIQRIAGIDVVVASSRTKVRPIVTRDNFVFEGDPVLMLVGRNERLLQRMWPSMTGDDKLVDEIYTLFQGGLRSHVGWPRSFAEMGKEEHRDWGQERREILLVLEALKNQAVGVSVETDPETNLFVFTARGAKKFHVKGRKDVLMAALYCYLAFAAWVEAMASGLIAGAGGETVCESF